MNRRFIAIAAAALAAVLVAALLVWRAAPGLLPWTLDPTDPRVTLSHVEQEVARRWHLPEITPEALARRMQAEQVRLIDVRTREEYEMGHLSGAIRVDPETTPEEFLAQHADILDGKPIVFYCAVGVRSSLMLQRLKGRVSAWNTGEVYNLRGGTFRWVADGKPLVAQSRPGKLHPYDDSWGQLLQRTLSK